MKKLIRKIFNNLGVEVRLVRSLQHQLRDAYSEQRKILRGLDVKTIFDVGSYDGFTSLKYHKYFPESTCYAFEPFSKSFEKLVKTSEENKFIRPFNYAIAERNGTASFHVNQEAMTNSLYASEKTDSFVDKLTRTVSMEEVKVTTLDEFTAQNGIEHIDILKLDVQGGELSALKGAEKLLKSGKVNLIYSEVEFGKIYKDQPLFHEVCAYLAENNYHLFGLYNIVHYRNGQISWCDAIFIRGDLRTEHLMNRQKFH